MARRRADTPAWVLARMEAQGLPHGRARPPARRPSGAAVPRWCECGRAVYVGTASGLPVVVDPAPVSIEGEGLAILDGRYTVVLLPDQTMYRRRICDIELSNADEFWICIEHRCNGPLPLVNSKYEPVKYRSDIPPY